MSVGSYRSFHTGFPYTSTGHNGDSRRYMEVTNDKVTYTSKIMLELVIE
jgi:hypothetical protein